MYSFIGDYEEKMDNYFSSSRPLDHNVVVPILHGFSTIFKKNKLSFVRALY